MSMLVHWRCDGTTACGQHDARYQDTLTDWLDHVTCEACKEKHLAHQVIVEVKLAKQRESLDVMRGEALTRAALDYALVRRPGESDDNLRYRVTQRIARGWV